MLLQASHSGSEHILRRREAATDQLRARSKLGQGVLVRDAVQHDGREKLQRHRRGQLGAVQNGP